jgi:hypothetical protein
MAAGEDGLRKDLEMRRLHCSVLRVLSRVCGDIATLRACFCFPHSICYLNIYVITHDVPLDGKFIVIWYLHNLIL